MTKPISNKVRLQRTIDYLEKKYLISPDWEVNKKVKVAKRFLNYINETGFGFIEFAEYEIDKCWLKIEDLLTK